VDDELAELFLAEEPITPEALAAAIRRATLGLRFQPVFMGSAFKNKGGWVGVGVGGGGGEREGTGEGGGVVDGVMGSAFKNKGG
jgi:hypothetical protein